jgi:hypothetical protein
VNIGPVFPQVAQKARAVVELAAPLAAMMASLGQALSVHETASAVANLLVPDELAQAQRSFEAWFASDLPTRIANADPDDAASAASLVADTAEYRRDVQAYVDALSRALGFGEATLQFGAIPDALERLSSAASTLQRYQSLDALRSFSEELQRWLMERLPASFAAVQTPVQSLLQELKNQVATWVAAIQGIDAASMLAPVTRAIGQVTDVIASINRAMDQAVAAFRAIITQVRDTIGALNLESLAESIRAFLQPISAVLARLEQLLEGSLGSIEAAMTQAVDAIGAAKATVLGHANAVKGAFDTSAAEIEKVLANLPAIIGNVEAGVQGVVDALRKIQLDPFFDTAIDLMSTTADVVKAVPLDLVPDDVEADLKQAVAPIRQIQFTEVRAALEVKRDEIKSVLDEGVLGELQQLYQALVTFLRNNDPRPPIEQLEATVFAGLLEQLQAIDPDAVLAPLDEVLSQAKGFVAELDPRALLLNELETAFDTILNFHAQLDPAALLEPISSRLDQLRTDVEETLRIETLPAQVDAIFDQLQRLLAVLDLDALIPHLERLFFPLLQDLRASSAGSPVIGTVLAAISAEPGVRAETASEVIGWIQGELGGARVRGELAGAALKLQQVAASVSALPLTEVAGRAAGFHRILLQALAGRSGPLGDRLSQVVGRAPEELLAPVLAYGPRYAAALTTQASQLRALAQSEFSEITTVSRALREALRPLAVVQQHLRGLLTAFGINPASKTLFEIFADVFAQLAPGEFLLAFKPLLEALKQKLLSLVEQGLVAPLKASIAELEQLFEQLDLSAFVDELTGVHSTLGEELEALRPSQLLGPALTSFESLQEAVTHYDPLVAVRAVIDEFKAAVEGLAGPQSPLRPTVVLKELLEAYQRILEQASELDFQNLLRPVINELDHLFAELDDGLERSETSFEDLKDALGRIGS